MTSKIKNNPPPSWADRFLQWYCAEDLLDEIQGDLYEMHDKRKKSLGIQRANLWFVWDVIRFFRLSSISTSPINNPLKNMAMMWHNYFKISLRNFRKYKFYSLINVSGLAIAVASVLVILLYVKDELSYDKFHNNASDLFRVVENQFYEGQDVFPVAVTPGPLAPSLKANFPEVTKATRVDMDGNIFYHDDQYSYEENGIYVDPDFLTMFSFDLIMGDPSTALDNPDAIILNETLAQKYFGDLNPLDQTIEINEGRKMRVTAVVNDVPANSHIPFNYIMPITSIEDQYNERYNNYFKNWNSNAMYTYVQLAKGSSSQDLSSRIASHLKDNGALYEVELFLQNVKEIHLYPIQFTADVGGHGNIKYVKLFSLIAGIILLIACINFTNLATARSARRAKEVGLRKTIGASRKQLFLQFLSESIFLSSLAVLLASVLVIFFLPYFNKISGKTLHIGSLLQAGENLFIFLGLLSFAVFTGVLAGTYPAIFLSKFKPVSALRNTVLSGRGSSIFRKVLVISQFTIGVGLIICTLTVYDQLKFMQRKSLGFEKDHILCISLGPDQRSEYKDFKTRLESTPQIQSVGVANQLISNVGNSSSGFGWEGKNPEDNQLFHLLSTDYDFFKTLQINFKDGRGFSQEHPTDTNAIILNETALALTGLSDPIGKVISNGGQQAQIIGIVSDFHFKSIHAKIEPLMLFLTRQPRWVYIRSQADKVQETIAALENTWKDMFPAQPFSYRFLDQSLANLYQSEQRTASIFKTFTFLAIFISCLGLFGLASYTLERRSKEMSVRKVLGASSSHLFYLLSWEYISLITVACLIAMPVAYWLMADWLNAFAYRINLGVGVFIIGVGAALVIALFTVSFQGIKAFLTNPIQALKDE